MGQRKFLQDMMKRIRSRVYGEVRKLKKNIIDYDESYLNLNCSGDAMLCGKYTLVVNENIFD